MPRAPGARARRACAQGSCSPSGPLSERSQGSCSPSDLLSERSQGSCSLSDPLSERSQGSCSLSDLLSERSRAPRGAAPSPIVDSLTGSSVRASVPSPDGVGWRGSAAAWRTRRRRAQRCRRARCVRQPCEPTCAMPHAVVHPARSPAAKRRAASSRSEAADAAWLSDARRHRRRRRRRRCYPRAFPRRRRSVRLFRYEGVWQRVSRLLLKEACERMRSVRRGAACASGRARRPERERAPRVVASTAPSR